MSQGPTQFGDYLLLERIAAGGMAEVYLADLQGLGGFRRRVALKKILPQYGDDHRFVDMLLDEARIAARLIHPNIVQVLNCGRIDGVYFMAMEYVDGVSFAQLFGWLSENDRSLTLAQSLYVGIKLMRALGFAHAQNDDAGQPMGIIHRDVSPHNILVSRDGEIKLADFGIARAVGKMHKTETGMVRGKLAYMAPEQFSADPIDHRADQFAAAIILFEALTVDRIYGESTDVQITRSLVQANELPEVRKRMEEMAVPGNVIAAVERGLAVDPNQRFAGCDDFADALAACVDEAVLGKAQRQLGDLCTEFCSRKRQQSNSSLLDSNPPAIVPEDKVSRDPPLGGGPAVPEKRTMTIDVDPLTESRLAGLDQAAGMQVSPANGFGTGIPRSKLAWFLMIGLLAVAAAIAATWTLIRFTPLARQGESVQAGSAEGGSQGPGDNNPDTSPPAPSSTASVTLVNAPPGAQITVDGRFAGRADDRGELRLTVSTNKAIELGVEKDGRRFWQTTVELEPSEERRLRVPAESPAPRSSRTRQVAKVRPKAPVPEQTGTLDVVCIPWCAVSIDGQQVSETSPLRNHVLTIGEHRVEVVNPPTGKRAAQTVEVRANVTEHLKFRPQ